MNAARAAFACVAWTVVALLLHGSSVFTGLTLAGISWLGVSIACSYVVGDGVFFAAAQRAGVSTALAVATIYPLWAALFGVLVRGETLSPWRAAGLVGCIVGVATLLRLGTRDGAIDRDRRQLRGSGARVGILLALLTSLFWAGNAVCLKQGTEGVSIFQANAVRFTLGAALLFLRVTFTSRTQSAPVSMLAIVRSLRMPLVVDVLFGSVCYAYGLAHSELALGVTLSSLSPLAALPIAVISGTERVTPARALCVCLIVASVTALVR